MFAGVGRLLLIFVGVLFFGILVVFGLRSLGQSDGYSGPFDDPFFVETKWFIVFNEWTKPDLDLAQKNLPSNAIAGAAVQSLLDGELIISNEHFVSLNGQPRFLNQMLLADFKALKPESLSLSEFLGQLKNRHLFIRTTHLNRMTGRKLGEMLKQHPKDKRIIIQAANQALKRNLKEIEPLWIFANTSSELGRLKVFASFFLETIASLDADAYVLDPKDENLIVEIRRRHRKILFESNLDTALNFLGAADGVIVTTRPENIPTDLVRQVDQL